MHYLLEQGIKTKRSSAVSVRRPRLDKADGASPLPLESDFFLIGTIVLRAVSLLTSHKSKQERSVCVSSTLHKAEVRPDSSTVSKRLAASGSCTKSWRLHRLTRVAGADSSAVLKRVAASGSRRRTSTATTQFTSTSVHVQKASKNKF